MEKKPSILIVLLENLLPDDLHHLIGDLEEEFHDRAEQKGTWNARMHFWSQVVRSLPYFILQSLRWNSIMLLNYLKVTWRNIRKAKVFSVINILGLAVSMAVCLLIILFIVDQKSYDRFHEYSDRIYRITSDFKSAHNNQAELYATTPAGLPDLLEEQFPEIEMATHIQGSFRAELKTGETAIPIEGLYADTTFFKLFSFELLRGNKQTALREPGSIILTEQAAERLFGDDDPMGKIITALGYRDFTVTGIINGGYRTHFRFEALASYQTLLADAASRTQPESWVQGMNDHYTYFLLKPGADPEMLQSKLSSLIPSHYTDPGNNNMIRAFHVQPLTAINLGPTKSNEIGLVLPNIIAWFLTGFAGIIVLIACFNYISLTVARAINRSKEVGVRKVMGAFRSNVIKQFLAESVIIALIALLFASLILKWLIPEFNSLFIIHFTESRITMDIWGNFNVFVIFILFSALVGILAGLYPAFYLSAFSPAQVLKGINSVRGISGQTLRKIITVSQFTFSIIFIVTAFILARQFNHMVNTDYGFTKEGIVNVALQDVPYDRFRNAVHSRPGVEQVAAASHIPALGQTWGVWLKSDSLSDEGRIRAHSFLVDEHYIETTGLNLVAGRNFNPGRSTDSSTVVILSTRAVQQLNLGSIPDAIGRVISVDGDLHEVVGVIENFISADPMRKGDPIVLIYDTDRVRYAIVKVRENNMAPFLSGLESMWAGLGSLHSLKYQLLDDQLRENPLLTIFQDFIKVIGLLSVFSIFISCLGLLGMAMYSAENRVKEIGIRKVLGASMKDIVVLLSREYLVLIFIAICIGTPLAYIINNLWMQAVSNKTEVGLLIYLGGILATMLLALLTISSQTIRAAMTNSIENLRSE